MVEEIKELQVASVATKKEEPAYVHKEISLDDIYRLRASTNITGMYYARTGRKDVPYYIYKKGLKGSPVAYVGSEQVANYLSKINDIVDIAIKNILENQKLQKELARYKKAAAIF